MKLISDNFELRVFSGDKCANGETDFKGETSTLTTEQRIEFLNAYAERMSKQYEDFSLEEPVVSLEEARERLLQIKPQPLPKQRKRIPLEEWKWIGYGKQKRQPLGRIEGNRMELPGQFWRCMLDLKLKEQVVRESAAPARKSAGESAVEGAKDGVAPRAVTCSFGEAVVFGWNEEGVPYYIVNQKKVEISERKIASKADSAPAPGQKGISEIRIELDFLYRKWNFYLDGVLCGDFVDFSCKNVERVSQFVVEGANIEEIFQQVWGVGYYPNQDNKFEPFRIETFVDEDFKAPVKIGGWNEPEYADERWQMATLPIFHGGERYAGQDIYMRKWVYVEQIPAYAELYLESLTPGGEVYINGQLACHVRDEVCKKIDVTDYLVEGENLFAVKVYADKIKEKDKMTHTHTDLYTGWFAGRMHLDLLPEIYIEDVFTWTESIEKGKAVQAFEVSVKARKGVSSGKTVDHQVAVAMRPWFPKEGAVSASSSWTTPTNPNMSEVTKGEIEVLEPKPWSSKSPSLYEFVVELKNPKGEVVDDYVVTTGIRTVSQEGGIFRINGEPELLRAPLLFGARPPLDKIAAWEKCPPAEFYIQEMLMVQRMNGNGFRMSVHDENIGGINDPRVCELADQMGIMLVWQTTEWLRLTSAYDLDYDKMVQCIKQVRNYPSIVIWQPLNHPSWKNWDMIMRVYRMMHEAISSVDKSRLISPAADSRRMRPRRDDGLTDFAGNPCEDCDPIWTAERICRGNMDYILGYGNEWSALRQWPNVEEKHLPDYMESTAYIPSYLNSTERAYFNFEHDEIVGQPNWKLYQGKPMYHVMSYEDYYDAGSIGRSLELEEWMTSQAWQAFGAYETICKCRWLDYDGLSWCNLRGGQNTATYQKSIVDYYGPAKIAYYAHRMAFQEVLACSGNVDVVYGPKDRIPVVVLNLGEEKNVTLVVEVASSNGQIVYSKEISNVLLPEGRSKIHVEEIELPEIKDGIYSVNYRVYA